MFVAIVQARVGSTRLPNKVMRKVLGKPLIGLLLERLSLSKHISKIILATTEKKEDEPLVEYVTSLGYSVFRGSENDVLGRYYHAFKSIESQYSEIQGIVRITGDCPLFEAHICDRLIDLFIDRKLDHGYLSDKFAEGLDCDVFTPSILEQAFFKAVADFEREHVTQFFKKIDYAKVEMLENDRDDSKYRITVDEKCDFELIKFIIESLVSQDKALSFNNVRQLLEDNPNEYAINSKVIRNEGLKISLAREE